MKILQKILGCVILAMCGLTILAVGAGITFGFYYLIFVLARKVFFGG